MRQKSLSAGTPGFSSQVLKQIAQDLGTPTYVYSATLLKKNYRELVRGLKDVDHRIFFAMKANSNLSILKLFLKLGAGMDIVSGGELFRAQQAGALPRDVVFSGVGKTPEELADALQFGKEGIYAFNVESEEELRLLNSIACRLGQIAPVSFRFNPDVDAKTHPYISTGLKFNKFGMHRAKVLELARGIHKFPGIRVQGVSIHIGSQLLSLAPLENAFQRVKDLIGELDELLPEPLTHVDLGGGLGICYSDEVAPSVASYCGLIRQYFGPNRVNEKGRALKVMLEPGRLLAGNAGLLLSQVLYWKKSERKHFLIIDAAMNDLIRPALYQSIHAVVPIKRLSAVANQTVRCDIVGPVCETGDFIARNRMMSTRLKGGDILAILSTGAYGFTMASNYNSRPRAAEVLVSGGQYSVIRNRESLADLIRNELI